MYFPIFFPRKNKKCYLMVYQIVFSFSKKNYSRWDKQNFLPLLFFQENLLSDTMDAAQICLCFSQNFWFSILFPKKNMLQIIWQTSKIYSIICITFWPSEEYDLSFFFQEKKCFLMVYQIVFSFSKKKYSRWDKQNFLPLLFFQENLLSDTMDAAQICLCFSQNFWFSILFPKKNMLQIIWQTSKIYSIICITFWPSEEHDLLFFFQEKICTQGNSSNIQINLYKRRKCKTSSSFLFVRTVMLSNPL